MPESRVPSQKHQRNPYTHEAHRRQSFWQILLPLIVFILVILAGAVIVSTSPAEKASTWADISLIFLILPTMFGFGVLALVTFVLVYAMGKALQIIPFGFYRVQDFFYRLNRRVRVISNQVVEPVMRIHSALEGTRTLRRALRRRLSRS
jgi:hypothetical protein